VAKAALTVTANAQTRAYGFANPTLTAAITGFVGGDTLGTAVSGAPGLSTTAILGSTPGTYPITTALGTLSAVNYTFSLVDGLLTVRLQEIADWQEDNFTPTELLDAGISGPAADPDLDGVSNLREYAFGTDPNDITSGPNGLVYTGSVNGGGTLIETGQPITYLQAVNGSLVTRLLFIRRTPAFTDDLTYLPAFSSNGTTWVSSSASPTVLTEDGLYQVVSIPYPLSTGGKKTRFYRVEIDLP
jgi:MBG domain (YGX type)